MALAAAGCNDLLGEPGQISQRIGEAANAPSAVEVDLTKLTTFGWDRLILFKSGTPKSEICAFIGATDAYCGRVIRHESVAGESMTMLFALNGQLTHAELHALSNGRFDVAPIRGGIPRAACVFKIRKELAADGKSVIWLTPMRPNPSIERTSQRPLRALWSTAHVER
jgi:hypothetical protein